MNRAWWSTATQWRNWPLLVKLGVVLVVPVVGALVLGVLRVRGEIVLAESYTDIERIAALRVELTRAVSAVQDERSGAMRRDPELERLVGSTDAAVSATRTALDRTPDLGETAAVRYRNLVGALGLLPYARGLGATGGDGTAVLSAYTAVVDAVLEFDRGLVGRFPDAQLTDTSIALGELQAVREQMGRQHAAGLLATRDGVLSAGERETLVEADIRLDENLRDFRTVAPPWLRDSYDSTVAGTAVAIRQLLVGGARSAAPWFTAGAWDGAAGTTVGLVSRVTAEAAQELRAESRRLAEATSDRAGAESVLLLTLVLLAAGIGGGLGRYLVRSFGLLRRTVLEVATTGLPAAVARIRAGDTDDVAVERVPPHTTEEFGQLARAFDLVHEQAVRSAADEAALRGDLRDIFLNLSRRSQGLVERQLRQLEQLEDLADDPEQLANLFRIDHLATRMRRNNENLMVLSGAVLGRRFTEPVALPDVLRAAVSEVEHYQRALVRSAPNARVVGYAAGDLIRSLAELIENATRFSPPGSQVVVATQLVDNGALVVEILDEGVGMADPELREANRRVAAGGVDVPVSRQMGLFVVGRLTERHGMLVGLERRESGGLRASVVVPANLVVPADAAPSARPAPTAPPPAPPPVPRPDEIADRLELAGIHVRIPDFPPAHTPASILFAAHLPVALAEAEPAPEPELDLEPGPGPERAEEFSWLRRPPSAAPPPGPAEPAASVAAPAVGAGGLPKRVPGGQLLVPTAPPAGATPRDPARARGFLDSFQAGIRDSSDSEGRT